MLNKMIAETAGILEVAKSADFGLSREGFYKYIKKNDYEKVGPGMFVSPDEFVDELLVLHKRCPKGVISHDEALYHYGLIDREPLFHTMTVYSGYNASRLIQSGYKIYYVNKALLEIGKISVQNYFGNTIPMYDMDRTIIDLIRNRSMFEIQDFTTALKIYARRSDKNLERLSEYAKIFRVEKIIRSYMEVLL